jgi:hypothetical protein
LNQECIDFVHKNHETDAFALQQSAATATGCLFGGRNMTELVDINVSAKGDFTPGESTSALEGATRAISAATDKIKSHESTISREYLENRDPKGRVLTCKACGIRQREDIGNYSRVPLGSALVLYVNENIEADHGLQFALKLQSPFN